MHTHSRPGCKIKDDDSYVPTFFKVNGGWGEILFPQSMQFVMFSLTGRILHQQGLLGSVVTHNAITKQQPTLQLNMFFFHSVVVAVAGLINLGCSETKYLIPGSCDRANDIQLNFS